MIRNILNYLSAAFLLSGILLAIPAARAQMRGGSPMGGQTGNMGQPGTSPNMQPNGTMGQQNNNQMIVQNTFANIRRNMQVETELSKMAVKNSSNDDVKKFAQQVIVDNRQMERDLTTPNASSAPEFPASVPSQTKKAEKQMKKETGQPFDQMYLVQMDAYVKNDRQTAQGADAMTTSPDAGEVGMKLRTMSDDRAKQIADLTKEENIKIQ